MQLFVSLFDECFALVPFFVTFDIVPDSIYISNQHCVFQSTFFNITNVGIN